MPEVSKFLENLGVRHQDIIHKCKGALKLGIRFKGFHKPGSDFTFPFGLGLGPDGTKFNTASVDLMMNTSKISKNIWNYSDISVHFRATDILKFMDTLLKDIPNLKVERREIDKNYVSDLSDSYDLLIDSTGFRRVASFQEDNFQSIQHLIPNNKALVYRHLYTDNQKQMLPYTTITAMEYGWTWQIPLKDHLATGYVHWDKFDVMDEYQAFLKETFGVDVPASDINSVKMVTGRNKIHLKDKVVAIGLASSFIEPLESTGLYLTTNALTKLCRYIDGEIDQAEYNELVNNDVDAITNFILAHYKYSDRSNEYWDHFKAQPITKYAKITIFPPDAWDYILSGFMNDVKRPKEKVDVEEMMSIAKGTPYSEWLKDDQNFV